MTDLLLPVYSGALIVAMVLALSMAAVAFVRNGVPGAYAFLMGNLAILCYALGTFLEIRASGVDQVMGALTLEYVGITTIGPLLFLTSISATRGANVVGPWGSVGLFVVPAVMVVMVATNDHHHLFYSSVEVTQRGPFTVPVLGHGPFYILNMIYMNVCIAAGVFVPLRDGWKAPRAHRTPLLLLVLGAVFPWSGMAIYQAGWSPWGLDIAPYGLTLSTVCFAIALFRFRLFDLTPLVTDRVFENMREGVLVVDQRDRIIGVNPALSGILWGVTTDVVGQRLDALGLPDLRAHRDLTLHEGSLRRIFQVDRSPLRDHKGRLQGELFMLTDITQREELAERLARLARVDELTDLPNRRACLERLGAEADRHRRYQGPVAVALADIDHFKTINDTWGHDAGDAALVHVARVWTSGLRSSDLLGRYGGEEFLFVLPLASLDQARALLERLRTDLASRPLPWLGSFIPITASFGLTSWGPEGSDESAESLIRRADKALYRAKEAGRNQVQG